MHFRAVASLSPRRKDVLTVCLGVFITLLWTLFRFSTKAVNFDQTGQQLLARQWLQGYTDGSITDAFERQFGKPVRTDILPTGEAVLIYSAPLKNVSKTEPVIL